ncbi:MAG: hypothetical protein EU549_02875 [Promethearchaeota archaeon]|nr:MAG: hypothetical protein EU549_02875 [Candidatus Lokiarchaeota archaeon]
MKSMSIENLDSDIKKIVLIGLDNAGKSSILLSLNSDTNLMSYFSLKPTIGIKTREIIQGNKTFQIWDFGGQKRFRDDYIDELDKHLIGTDKIIFVFDIQDVDRYDIAFDYLKKIVDFLYKSKMEIDFSIFLHKFDPGIEEKEEFKDPYIQKHIINRFKKIFSENRTIKIFKTTIYTIFEKKQYFAI